MVTPRKRRARHTDVLGLINGINRNSPATRKRRQTTPRASVYDLPVSPEKPTEASGSREVTATTDFSQSQVNSISAQEAGKSVSVRQSTSEEDEQSDEAVEPSDHDEDEDNEDEIAGTPTNNEEEEYGEPFQGHLNLFSDANEAPSESRQSSPPRAREESSSVLLEPEDQVAPSESRESSPPGPQEESSSVSPGPDDQVAVVVPIHGIGHLADGDARSADDDSSSSPHDSSVPETPPALPIRYTRSPRPRAEDFDVVIEAIEQSDQDGSEYEPENEHQDGHDSPVQIPVVEQSNQTENEHDADHTLRELRTWFSKEIEGSTMEADWKTLYLEGRGLRRFRSKPMPEYLQESRRLIANLREMYEEIIQSETFSSTQEAHLKNLRESIYADARQVFEYASETMQDASVLDQFEAHLIPRMVTLVQFSFRTFTLLGQSAADQLYGTLDLVLRCSVRVDDYRKSGYLAARAWSKRLHVPLKRLKTALKSGRLNDHLPTQPEATQTDLQPSQPLTQSSISPSHVPWTLMEEEALIEGLRQYSGDDRFVLIIKYLGHRLRRRTIRDLKAKAHEFRRQALRNGVLDQYTWL